MEAPCGKNPSYHTGKLFTAIGDIISKEIYEKYNIENVVFCTSKMGDNINNPWNISIELNKKITEEDKKGIETLVENIVSDHIHITNDLVLGNIKLNSY